MKRMFTLIGLTVLALWCAACQGEIGPEGSTGPTGEEGALGPEGLVGPLGPGVSYFTAQVLPRIGTPLEWEVCRSFNIATDHEEQCTVFHITESPWADIGDEWPFELPLLSCYVQAPSSGAWLAFGLPFGYSPLTSGGLDFRGLQSAFYSCGLSVRTDGLWVWIATVDFHDQVAVQISLLK